MPRAVRHPHDPSTGEEVEKEEVVRGYEYERGQYITFTPDELKALDLESSKVIDLETFVPHSELDPVYFNSPYYLYPDGQMAVEAIRVIGAAMGEAGVVGIGHLTLSRRERTVVVEPRGTGMVLITLRAADEVRAPQFTSGDGAIDAEMLAKFLDVCDQIPGCVFFERSVRRALSRTALIEQHDAVGFRIMKLPILGHQPATRPAMQEHHRLAFWIAALFVIKLVNVGDFQTAGVVGLDWIVEGF